MKTKLLLLVLPVIFATSCGNATPSKPLLRRYEYYFGVDRNLRDVQEYEYYSNEKIKRISDYDYSSSKGDMYLNGVEDYTYSDEKDVISRTDYDSDGKVEEMSIEEYGRDEFSRQSFYRYQYSADEGKTWTMTDDDTYSYKFDSKGNLISIESKDNINDTVMGVEYEYNDSNICILESDYAVEEETKIYFEKRIYDYKQEDNYRTETTTAYYIEGDEEEFIYKDIYFYDNSGLNFKNIYYEEDEDFLDSMEFYSFNENVVVQTSYNHLVDGSYRVSSVTTRVYDKDFKKGGLLLSETIVYPSSVTGDCKKTVRNYKYDNWGNKTEMVYASYNIINNVEKISTTTKEIWIYK